AFVPGLWSLPMPVTQNQSALLELCRQRQPEMLDLLRRLVEMESPSDNKEALDGLGRFLGAEFSRLGAKVTFIPQSDAGDHLKAELPGNAESTGKAGKPILLLG